MWKCSLPARIRASLALTDVVQPSPERHVGKVSYFCKESGMMLGRRGAGAERTHAFQIQNEGLFGLQWPYFVSETLLYCCST